MKTALRILAALAFLLLLAGGAAYIWRMPLAAWLAEGQLEKLGLTDPEVTVTGLSTKNVALSLGSAELTGEAAVTYDLGTVLRERRVFDIHIARLEGAVRLMPEGTLKLEGLDLPGGGGDQKQGTGLPFRQLTIEDAAIRLLTPEGEGLIEGNGRFAPGAGGALSFSLAADRLGLKDQVAEKAKLSGDLEFREDGRAVLESRLGGDVITADVIARNVDLKADGALEDWRPLQKGKLPQEGRLSIEISSAALGTETTAGLQSLTQGAPELSSELELVTLTGTLEAVMKGGALTVRIPGNPIEARGSAGSYLRLVPDTDNALLVLEEDSARAAASLEVSIPQLAGDLALKAGREGEAPWAVDIGGQIGRGTFGAMTMSAHRLAATGTYKEGVLRLESDIGGRVGQLQLGALTVTEAMLRAKLPLFLDLGAGEFSIPDTEDTSLVIGGARLLSANGSVSAALGPTEVLPEGGPLIRVLFGEEKGFSGGAGVRLSRLTANAGETSVNASSLRGGASLSFDNTEKSTTLSMSLTGGTALINDSLQLSGIAADGNIRVLTGKATGEVQIKGVTVTETRDAPRVAPMRVSGPAKLADGRLAFDVSVATPKGQRLGKVEGYHVFESGVGAAEFDSGELVFTPGGLQPSGLIPPLKGIVSKATGSLTGRAKGEWGRGPLRTSAVITPQSLSFTGPGVAVERTEEVSGTLTFSNLLPVTTDGIQKISVGRIDFGSIALPDGTVEFALPGDDTLVVEEALFPLFEGRLIADDTVIGFDGGSVATLRVEEIDLAELLTFLDIEGLRGEGQIEGELPFVFEDFAVRIVNGQLRATSPGSIQFTGDVAEAAAQTNPGARLAFDALENLRFTVLSATVNGRLDGNLDFTFQITGESEVDLSGQGTGGDVTAPVILRTNIQLPLISLVNQARMSFDARLQLEAAQKEANQPQE